MGFSAEAIANLEAGRERQERRDKWICEPGLHVVSIVRWNYAGAYVGRDVVFEVHDGQGRKQFVRFNLPVRSLRNGELLRFVVAAMSWREVEHQGCELSVNHRTTYDLLIGRRIAVVVMRGPNGMHSVVDWETASQ